MPDVNPGPDPEDENSELETEELTEEEAEFLADETGVPDIEPIVKRVENPTLVPDPDAATLPSGRAMWMTEAVALTAIRKHKVILIAGAPKSGKTSLISDIFVSFQKGEFSNLFFAGSHTLMGLEERCWNARTIALPQVPQTKRTSRQDPTYLQLSVLNIQSKRREEFLISDISGEVFAEAANSTEGCEAIKDIAWADHFVLVLDGEKLATVAEREFVTSQAKQILFRLLDSTVLSKNSIIEIVFSKADRLNLSNSDNKEFIARIRSEFRSKLKERGVTADFFYTSAHNIYGQKDKPFDLTKLLTHWVSKDRLFPIDKPVAAAAEITREIDRFAQRLK